MSEKAFFLYQRRTRNDDWQRGEHIRWPTDQELRERGVKIKNPARALKTGQDDLDNKLNPCTNYPISDTRIMVYCYRL